ncbi:zinc-binding dehydrogenase [Xanthomonas bundabergensis]|uniref:zinc-binding dehydrogenase n=1 Tax=Xanthomonas bundabergensis TaxID=3160842 RepID=UPI00351702C2
MTASGNQLREIGALLEAGIIRPVIDRVFPLEATAQALGYAESGRAMGKLAIGIGQHRARGPSRALSATAPAGSANASLYGRSRSRARRHARCSAGVR